MGNVKVLQIFGSLGMGGAESRMMDVYRNIDRDVYSFDFLTMQDEVGYYEPELHELGANIIHIKNPRDVNVFAHLRELYRVMKDGGYNAVHAHTSYHCGLALVIAWLARVPVRVAHARTTGTKQHSFKSKIAFFIGRSMTRLFSTHRLAISQNAGKFLFGNFSSFKVVPNTICVSKYMSITKEKIDAFKCELGIPKNSFVIGQIGRFDEMKNHRFTLKWFSKYRTMHPDAHLVFVGDGVLRLELETIANEWNLRDFVSFTGVRGDIPELIHIFDVLFFPSIFEGLGGVVLEAQAAGIPIVESENIPGEADLNLGMVLRCSLNDDLSRWNEAVDKCRDFACPNKSVIKAAFDSNGFSIEAVTDTYCKLYKGRI